MLSKAAGDAATAERRDVPLTSSVWIVEDSPLEAEMARRQLAQSFEVELFADGPAMIERLSQVSPPAVLVLDWHLPNMSGIEVLSFVRRSFDEMSLPILMLTVRGGKEEMVEGLSAGANDYLSKPYDEAELRARVTSLHRLRKLSDELRDERRHQRELLLQAREASMRAERANRAKDDFLATVSHELRTPLNAIAGWVSLLRSASLPPERVADALDTIDRNARAQTRLIDDLLDVSRIISGKLSLAIEPTDMAEVVGAAVTALRPTAAAKQISLDVDIASPVAPTLGDASRLQQVVWNLLANALKFTPSGGKVEVRLGAVEGGLELIIRDDGQGIAVEALPLIFDRFNQAESSFTRSHGGLGLGLAIVRHLVDSHGGRVSAESAGPGRGATFRVFVPALQGSVNASSPRKDSWRPAPSGNVLSGLRVLLVDDEADGREATALLLSRAGALVETADSAREALKALDRAVPDILLSDIGMPEEDGLSLLRKVRARASGGGGGVPALAITAYARSEDRAQSLLAGFDGYVTKPIDPTELIAMIARLTGKSARRSPG
jgi:signal transduction histidine kinase